MTTGFPRTNTDPTLTTGFYLAAADTHGGRGMTASSGIAAFEFLSGSGNNTVGPGNDMPMTTVTATAADLRLLHVNYDNNLQIDTVAAAFNNAQFAVVMLGHERHRCGPVERPIQHRPGQHRHSAREPAHRRNPEHDSPRVGLGRHRLQRRDPAMAQSRSLPLIDFYAEILSRRSGTTWQNTLIGSDGIHPTSVNSAGDPYTPGGNPATHTTGTNCLNDGYLLRGWLTMQKLKEVKSFVIDGNPAVVSNPTPTPPAPTPTPTPTPTASTKSGGGGGGKCGGSVAGPVSPFTLLGAAIAALLLARAARKTGF